MCLRVNLMGFFEGGVKNEFRVFGLYFWERWDSVFEIFRRMLGG